MRHLGLELPDAELDLIRRGASRTFFLESVAQWVPQPSGFGLRLGTDGLQYSTAEAFLRRDLTFAEFESSLFRRMGMAAGPDLLSQG